MVLNVTLEYNFIPLNLNIDGVVYDYSIGQLYPVLASKADFQEAIARAWAIFP